MEEFGAVDGVDIVNVIAGDYSELYAEGVKKKMDNYLAQFGTSFEEMRKLLFN